MTGDIATKLINNSIIWYLTRAQPKLIINRCGVFFLLLLKLTLKLLNWAGIKKTLDDFSLYLALNELDPNSTCSQSFKLIETVILRLLIISVNSGQCYSDFHSCCLFSPLQFSFVPNNLAVIHFCVFHKKCDSSTTIFPRHVKIYLASTTITIQCISLISRWWGKAVSVSGMSPCSMLSLC